MTLVHYFYDEEFASPAQYPSTFNDPFRYCPCPAVIKAAQEVMDHISSSKDLSGIFAEGKMIGILLVKDNYGKIGYLRGFSGNVGGRNHLHGFVPPIYNLLDPNGYFKTKEQEITDINSQIASLKANNEYIALCQTLDNAIRETEETLQSLKDEMASSKLQREQIRRSITDNADNDTNKVNHTLELLTRESQHQKAEFRRIKKSLETNIDELRQEKLKSDTIISKLKLRRKEMSDALQMWIFDQYIIHNAKGQCTTLRALFASQKLVPPAGTGECAAPKLLEYAYRHNLRPLAMGEFWYGTSPDTAVRTHGHFYPSCTSKCGPLLGYMLQGLETKEDTTFPANIGEPAIIYRDEQIVVADKPSGMPSVPGLDNRLSLAQWLEERLCKSIHTVHRLDMDTSGVIIYAFDPKTAATLQRQFEDRTVRKEYFARLCPADNSLIEKNLSTKGEIVLALSPDYDERPRQKVDTKNGKQAITEYEIVGTNPDLTTDIIFRPITGRTHQLRVHAAHILGLGRPILGDLLYGGQIALTDIAEEKRTTDRLQNRLYLHSQSITLTHPLTGQEISFCTKPPFA